MGKQKFTFAWPAASGAKMARGAYGALGVGHWGGLTRDVYNL